MAAVYYKHILYSARVLVLSDDKIRGKILAACRNGGGEFFFLIHRIINEQFQATHGYILEVNADREKKPFRPCNLILLCSYIYSNSSGVH